MTSISTHNPFDLQEPISIDIESAEIAFAQRMSNISDRESDRWQSYLNTLGYLAFARWLDEIGGRSCKQIEYNDASQTLNNVSFCQFGQFKCCLLIQEHVHDEIISIPQFSLSNALTAPHFYVVAEVLEEQHLVTFRGFSRFDTICQFFPIDKRQSTAQESYPLELSQFNSDLTHLLFYSRFLDPAAILAPQFFPQLDSHQSLGDQLTPISQTWNSVRTHLNQWFQGCIEDGWSAIDDLIDPQSSLAFGTRSRTGTIARGKLLNLGLTLQDKTVALIVNITPEDENKMKVVVQLHPTTGERYLSDDLQLTLLSKTGTPLQEVQARSHDNYIQLKPFIGEMGKLFTIGVRYSGGIFREDFTL